MIRQINTRHKYPDKKYIMTCLNARFGSIAKMANPILVTCAEEFENILMSTVLNREGKTVYVSRPEYIMVMKRKEAKPKYAYTCKNCGVRRIFNGHQYCPICGRKIKWT
jgi:rubrerythrin